MTKEELKAYEEQLKPCPFCGKKATIYQDEWGFNLISCHNTDCPIEPCTTKRDIEQAVKDWNTRAISALSENKATSGEYIRKADMERILYSTNNAVRIGEEFLELQTYSFPDSAKTDTAKPESDLISRTQAINDYAQCFADEYGMDCGEMFIGVLHQCPTFPDSAEREWIPVSERLPDVEHVVYCQLTDGSHEILFLNDCEGRMTWIGRRTGTYDVIAWRELPESYKGE